jgi:hypothetical protein
LVGWLAGWLFGWLVGASRTTPNSKNQSAWLVGWLAGWLVGRGVIMVGWLVGRGVILVGWLVGWLAGWLAGWLVGWLVVIGPMALRGRRGSSGHRRRRLEGAEEARVTDRPEGASRAPRKLQEQARAPRGCRGTSRNRRGRPEGAEEAQEQVREPRGRRGTSRNRRGRPESAEEPAGTCPGAGQPPITYKAELRQASIGEQCQVLLYTHVLYTHFLMFNTCGTHLGHF